MGTNSNEIQKDEENYIVRQKKKSSKILQFFLTQENRLRIIILK
jgi:hypothetical protein